MLQRTTYLKEEQKRVSDPGELRPIITSLNGDNSWLWSFPRPLSDRHGTGKSYFHIVFEPWLNGPTSQFSSWMIHIRLSSPAAVSTAEDVNDLIREIEESVSPEHFHPKGQLVDAILLGFFGPDHLHEASLRMFDPSIPVIASKDAVSTITPWNYFTNITIIPEITSDTTSWQDTPRLTALPPYLTSVLIPGHHFLNYCLAIIWTNPSSNEHELMIQSPHGVDLAQTPLLTTFLSSTPSLTKSKPLALFHGLKESFAYGSRNTFGAEAGLALYRRLGGPSYWVLSHDSVLLYSGILMRILWVNDVRRTLEWAIGLEKSKADKEVEEAPNLVRVGNGEGMVLL